MRAALLALLAAGCASSGRPAPIELRADAAAPATRGETGDLWEGPGVPLSAYALTPEEAFSQGRPTAHVVRAGETLFALASRYQVPLRALIDANGLGPPFALTPGTRLALPPPARHTVSAGDTYETIGRRYAVDPRSVALFNRRSPSAPIRAGEVLLLPAGARAVASARPAPSAPPPRRPTLAQAEPPPAPQASPRGYVWPVDGVLTAQFGAQAGGRRSDGVDIAARAGAPVKAAADGTVVYSGDDLPGYGNLMLVQHSGGIVTAYARLGAVRARVGAPVRKGETIAEVGASRVHFQIRAGGRPLDPTAALPPRG